MVQALITGTREGRGDVWGVLDAYVAAFGRPERLIVGDAPGVDLQALEWAEARGVPVHRERADIGNGWDGPARNTRMVAMCRPGDHCLAFPYVDQAKQKGTRNCYDKAKAAGLVCWWL